ncbi:MAG: amino acid ABC transporter permease [Spirochaetaceae bacterium]|nr:amino acid ABC transporter permease [Spirochaetaceae bacterium]
MFWTVTVKLFDGFALTFLIFVVTLFFSLILGLPVAFGSMSRFKPLRWFTRTFVWGIRGTPLMLQVIIVFYGPALIWDGISPLSRMAAVLVAFIINYSAYFSEIYRGGIEAIPKGQYEAAQTLGMTKVQIFFRVVLAQVIKRIVPPMSNEILTLVKDTSLARIIAVKEIIWMGQEFIASRALLWPLFYTGAFYLVFCGLLTLIFGKIEEKLDYFEV